jgi:hypothetical protein
MGHWFMWLFLVASFFLPTVAVIIANASSRPDPGGLAYFDPDLSTRAIDGPDPART